nr:immunoglobulin heavy chain junction region [Mus musculus]
CARRADYYGYDGEFAYW